MEGIELLTIAGGIGAGITHCLLGPDHLAAVLPFAAHAKKSAARVGMMWGLGHGGSVIVLGGLAQVFKSSLDVDSISGVAELMVGVLLIGLGLWTLRSTRAVVVHTHEHDHDHAAADDDHHHAHLHIGDRTADEPRHLEEGRHGHRHSALFFGGLHGLAGTSHLLGVLPSMMLDGVAAWLYLVAFLVGSILAMTAFATVAGHTLATNAVRLKRSLTAAGSFSIVVGVVWIVQTI